LANAELRDENRRLRDRLDEAAPNVVRLTPRS